MNRSLRLLLIPLILVAALVAGCGSDSKSDSKGSGSGSGSDGGQTGTITIDAAASLTEAFTTIGKDFESANPGVKVKLNFGPSSGLSESIQQGAPVDVFASAATSNMDDVVKAGDASDPKDFVTNTLQIAVPANNPGHVTGVSDLAKKGVKVAVCQAEVPCGVVATEVFKKAGVKVTPVSEEADVKSVLTKVSTGEVDAGLVYVTDVRAAGDKVKGVDIPDDVNASTTYPIAVVKDTKHATVAQKFVDYVLSDAGQKVLTADGFAPPPAQ